MIARMQQAITAGLIVAAMAWLMTCLRADRPLLGVAGLAGLFLFHSLVLGVELWLMRRSMRRGSVSPPPARDLLVAWAQETWCAPRVFCWRQPFRTHAWPDQLQGAGGRRGILLVHGLLCNRGVWNGWYRRLSDRRIPYLGVSLEPVFGSIGEYCGQIDEAVERLIAATGMPPVIVAHSMGGLAVRAWLRRCGGGAGRIHHVVTLATPHHGTALVKVGLSPNIREMAVDSGWLRELAEHESPALARDFTCIFSRCDNVVFPPQNALLAGAGAFEIARCAHVQMVDHPQVFDLVCRLTGVDASSPLPVGNAACPHSTPNA